MIDTPTIFSINGREYRSLAVIGFNLKVDVIDGEGSGRTQSEGLPMFREPRGTFKNFDVTLGLTNSSKNGDFIHILSTLDDFGKTDFKQMSFATPSGKITQEMYATKYALSMKRIKVDGVTYWGSLKISCVAKAAIIV